MQYLERESRVFGPRLGGQPNTTFPHPDLSMSFAQSIPPSGTEAFKNLDFYENNLKHESDIFLGNQLSNIIDITGQTDEGK